ncbi:sugar phosphate isomerase/epimerase [Crenobacter sp. SG2303]|uniref:Sugar phosphate isomerase/epimerase n=1 Tax=Crenobacter oryzisoli TaxID=3056844 RepID=A0ABT7XN11_9NEIS|nr:sugar phosphate isomerase/epimerase [Crenobacter sp. SG2303]MDN0075161.1 sugar phosphate isomerase/epimerase [Crenobacter sp. SG2303]
MTSRILSLAALTVLELSPPDMVSCAAEAGYSHIGLRLLPATPTEPQHDIVGDTPLLRETLARLADTGVAVSDIEILRLKPETCVADFLPVLETGARLGARDVLVAGNDADPVRLADNFARLCELGAPLNLAMNIEPMPWTEVRNLKDAAALLASANRPANAGVLIDAIHFDRAGCRIEEIAELPEGVLRYAQLCDAPADKPRDIDELLLQARAERMTPGEGGLKLAELLRALPATLPLSIEVPQAALARTVGAVERARRLREASERLLERVFGA